MSSFVVVLQLGGSCELLQWLREQFLLTASRIILTVGWSRDELLVSAVLSPDFRLLFGQNSKFLVLFHFPPSSWMGYFLVSWQVSSIGWGRIGSLVPIFKIGALACWSLWGHGRGMNSIGWLLRSLIAIMVTLAAIWLLLPHLFRLWGVGWHSFRLLVDHTL